MVPPADDHDCGWKAYAAAQAAELADVKAKLVALEQLIFAKKSERRKTGKMPPPIRTTSDPETAATKRAKNRDTFDAHLETETIPVPVPAGPCEKCGGDELRVVGKGKPSSVIEYVQPYFRRRTYVRETKACRCGHIITAPAPDRVGSKTRYSPSFVAHLAVSKCSDSMPQYRLEKAYRNLGIPLSRSTMCDLFHRGAEVLRPLYDAAVATIPKSSDVHADETSIRQLGLDKRAFIWGFVTRELVVYHYAPSRSGEVPKQILGDSTGRLVVDQYTGYNAVTKPGMRTRAGCLAHARRNLFEASEHPETTEALDMIGEIYVVERDAKAAGIVGTEEHLALRTQRSRGPFARLLWWARRHRDLFEPRSVMGKAIRYIIRHRRELGQFLRHATIPPDNNVAEAALRRIALGRANFLFVANEQSGRDHAVLYTLVASCEKHGVNPIAYITDMLLRVPDHPSGRIADLLPHRWRPP